MERRSNRCDLSPVNADSSSSTPSPRVPMPAHSVPGEAFAVDGMEAPEPKYQKGRKKRTPVGDLYFH